MVVLRQEYLASFGVYPGQEQNVAPFSVPQAQPKNNARGITQRKTQMLYMDITPLKKEHHLLNCHSFMGSKFQPFMCWIPCSSYCLDCSKSGWISGVFRPDFQGVLGVWVWPPFPKYQWMFHEEFIGMPYESYYLEDHPMTCKWLITMVIVSPLNGGNFPFQMA